jgi:NADH:ubiquinone reductase (H+-translocating)
MSGDGARTRVIVVGGGFAGVACARKLASDGDVAVTLVDRHDYHQFQPLLYQVATCQLAGVDIAYPLAKVAEHAHLEFKQADVTAIDPLARTVTTASGETLSGDYLVLAAGSQAFFFKTPGAREHAFPLYSLDDARRLRARILTAFDDADRDPTLIEAGTLEFVVVGGGPTGVEVAGAISEMIHTSLAAEYPNLAVDEASVRLVNHGHELLAAFSDKAHEYAAKVLTRNGVKLMLGIGVTEVGPGHVVLSDGSTIKTRCVVWGGGLKAAPIAAAAGLAQGRGGRIDVQPDFTVDGYPGVYVIGDIANIPSPDGKTFPQLGSVALQSGTWAARNILGELQGKAPRSFHYLDKGIMAMIGRGAAVAEVGQAHHGLHGAIAFAAWLGVHAALMSGVHNRTNAFVEWAGDYLGSAHGPYVLDRSETPRIDWGDDDVDGPTAVSAPADAPVSA